MGLQDMKKRGDHLRQIPQQNLNQIQQNAISKDLSIDRISHTSSNHGYDKILTQDEGLKFWVKSCFGSELINSKKIAKIVLFFKTREGQQLFSVDWIQKQLIHNNNGCSRPFSMAYDSILEASNDLLAMFLFGLPAKKPASSLIIYGASGTGKSAFLRSFLTEIGSFLGRETQNGLFSARKPEISCVYFYNSDLIDLFDKKRKLKSEQDCKFRFFDENIADQVCSRGVFSATNTNSLSSRGHKLMQINFMFMNEERKFYILELAGGEKEEDIKNCSLIKELEEESKYIESTLSNVAWFIRNFGKSEIPPFKIGVFERMLKNLGHKTVPSVLCTISNDVDDDNTSLATLDMLGMINRLWPFSESQN